MCHLCKAQNNPEKDNHHLHNINFKNELPFFLKLDILVAGNLLIRFLIPTYTIPLLLYLRPSIAQRKPSLKPLPKLHVGAGLLLWVSQPYCHLVTPLISLNCPCLCWTMSPLRESLL